MTKRIKRGVEVPPSLPFLSRDEYLMTHTPSGLPNLIAALPKHRRAEKTLDNLHLVDEVDKTSVLGFPQMNPYNGKTDLQYVSYKDRKKFSGEGCALGFFMPDSQFKFALWDKFDQTTHSLINYEVLIAPDFSLYVGDVYAIPNMMNVYRSRLIGATWQRMGFQVIPCATWGDANSFKYCFEGLPENSVIAVCGIGHDWCYSATELWMLGIKRLYASKHPTAIIVYGGKEISIPGVDVPIVFIKDFINQRFRGENGVRSNQTKKRS